MIITIILLVLIVFVLLIRLKINNFLIVSLNNESKNRLEQMLQKDEYIVDLLNEKTNLEIKIEMMSWNDDWDDSKNDSIKLSDKDFKTILQYIHPDKTGKNTEELFIKVRNLKDTSK